MSRTPLGPVVLGTMRFPSEPDGRSLASFLTDVADLGFITHHSSSEYDTYDSYCRALRLARDGGTDFRHVTKIAEPSWDHDRFDPQRFRARIEQECEALGTAHIDVVQWLVRTADPTDVAATTAVLRRDRDAIVGSMTELAAEGVVGRFFGFPYTNEVASEMVELQEGPGPFDGFTLYLNEAERGWSDLAERAPTLAIRPFAGGEIPPTERRASLDFALGHAGVEAAIVSVSSRDHARIINAWVG